MTASDRAHVLQVLEDVRFYLMKGKTDKAHASHLAEGVAQALSILRTPQLSATRDRARKVKPVPTHPGPHASDAAIHAFYKATSHVEDVRFFLKCITRSCPGLVTAAAFLLSKAEDGTLNRAETFKQLARLKAERAAFEHPAPDEVGFWRVHRERVARFKAAVSPKTFKGVQSQSGGRCWPPMGTSMDPAVRDAVWGVERVS